MKRVAIIADLHCGHEYGLTPPSWWYREDADNAGVQKAAKFQRELWKWYTKAIDSIKPITILLCNGDAIDGKGDRSGSIEQITTDRHEQTRMAAQAIDYACADKVRALYGTRYHVGKEEDFEALLCDMVQCEDVKVEGHGFYTVDGVTFDVKHKVSGSGVPHGRLTAIARANLWNRYWHSEHERQPKSDVIIRSHVHYSVSGGGPSWLGLTTPALTYNSAFGTRECEGIVDVGLIYFDVEDGGYEWTYLEAEFAGLKVVAESL